MPAPSGASEQIARKQFKRLAILPGEIVDEREELVKDFPDRFVRVLPEGVDSASALVCVADEYVTKMGQSGEIARRVYRGQLVSQDDELAAVCPEMFAPVGTSVSFGRETIITARPDQVTSDSGNSRFTRSFAD